MPPNSMSEVKNWDKDSDRVNKQFEGIIKNPDPNQEPPASSSVLIKTKRTWGFFYASKLHEGSQSLRHRVL